MVPLVYCTVLRTLKPCDWPLPSIPFHFFCACVCVHSSDSEPRTLAPCLNLDATPRISMTSTLTFLPPKAASKQASKRALFMTSPHHSPVRWKCDLLFYSSYPVPLNCLFLFLYIVFSFDVVTQEVARSNPPRFQNSLSVQELYSTLAQLLHTKPFPVVRQGIATKKHAALATPSNKGIRRVFKALLCIMYI